MDTHHVLHLTISGLTAPQLCRLCWFRNMHQALVEYRQKRKESVGAPQPAAVEEIAATET